MIPDRERIERAYDWLFTPEGSLTDDGRHELEQRTDGPDRRKWIPSEIAVHGAVRNPHPWYDGAPYVRMKVPRSGNDAFGGEVNLFVVQNFDMEREKFIDATYRLASGLPFHQGDSGAPFVSITEDGDAYLAGVVSDERSRPGALDSTYVRPRVSSVSTGSVSDILLRMGQYGDRTNKDEWEFWVDPNNSVADEDNWDEKKGDMKLLAIPEATNDEYYETCESSGSSFCRYLRSEPTREYTVTPVSLQVTSPPGETNPYGGVYILYGTISYFSPQNDPDNFTGNMGSTVDSSSSYAMNLPIENPLRKVIARALGPDGRLAEHTDYSPLLPPQGVNEAIITANIDSPTICLASSSGVGNRAFRHPLGYELISPKMMQCTVLDELTKNADVEHYNIPIDQTESGARISVQFSIEPR